MTYLRQDRSTNPLLSPWQRLGVSRRVQEGVLNTRMKMRDIINLVEGAEDLDDLFSDEPSPANVSSFAAAGVKKAVKDRGYKPPAMLTTNATERQWVEHVASEQFPKTKWEYQYTNWYPAPPFGAVSEADAGYYHTILIALPPRRNAAGGLSQRQDERRIPASRGWFPTEQEVQLRWENDHPHDALSQHIKQQLSTSPKKPAASNRPNLGVVKDD